MGPEPSAITSTDLLTVEQAAEFVHCSINTIHNLTRARAGLNVLPHIRLGKRLLFLKSDLVAYLLARRTTEPAPRRAYRRKARRKA